MMAAPALRCPFAPRIGPCRTDNSGIGPGEGKILVLRCRIPGRQQRFARHRAVTAHHIMPCGRADWLIRVWVAVIPARNRRSVPA